MSRFAPRRPVRSVCVVATAGVVASTALMSAASTASAASIQWNPSDHATPWLADPSVDGQVSVTSVSNTDSTIGTLRTWTTSGSPVAYNGAPAGLDNQWSPGGDLVLNHHSRSVGASPTSSLEHPRTRAGSNPAFWSALGDSWTTSARTSATQWQPQAQWVDGGRTNDALAAVQGSDPGAAAVSLWDGALVRTTASPDVPGKRDLAVSDSSFARYLSSPVRHPNGAAQTLGYGALDARLPVVSPTGDLFFVGTGADGTALFVDEGSGAQQVALLGADCPGQRPAVSASGSALAYVVAAGGDCSAAELHLLRVDPGTGSFLGGTDSLLARPAAGQHFETASWRAHTVAAASYRLAGSNRIGTAVSVSRWGWDGSDGAVIASSESFPDAVVAGPLAAQADIPLLINPKGSLNSVVLAELKRLMPARADRWVYIVGGTGVISKAVTDALAANGFTVVRVSGADRYATSVAVAKELDAGWSSSGNTRLAAFLADGTNFPDALSAGPAASTFLAPVLLTNGKSVPSAVKSYVNGRAAIKRVYSVGGQAATASATFGARASGNTVWGSDRYATSVAVAKKFFSGAWAPGYASGQSFPDALTGGALVGAMREPIVLVKATGLTSGAAALAESWRPATDQTLVFGGTAVVGESVRRAVGAAAGTQTALYGPDVPSIDNPQFPGLAKGGSKQARQGHEGLGFAAEGFRPRS